MQTSVEARSEHKREHASMHASPSTAHASIDMHACESRRHPTCKQACRKGLTTYPDTHAYTCHQPLLTSRHACMHASPLTKASAYTRVSLGASKHTNKRTNKVSTHMRTPTHACVTNNCPHADSHACTHQLINHCAQNHLHARV
jgi:hypothetical protein